MTEGLKYDSNKPGMDLLPVEAKKAIAEVFDFGAKKYARHNWRNGFDYSRLIAACERHIDAFNDGEDLDPESGKSHLAHAGCCVMMLLESVIKGYGVDNRHTTKFHRPNEILNISEPKRTVDEKAAGVAKASFQADELNKVAHQIEDVRKEMKEEILTKEWLEQLKNIPVKVVERKFTPREQEILDMEARKDFIGQEPWLVKALREKSGN